MKLVIYPSISEESLRRIRSVSERIEAFNAQSEAEAEKAIADADAFYGRITPKLLKAAKKLHWIQAPMAGLEHYMFPELVEHPVVLTNMRGIYSDVIADHVLGFIISFARGFHLWRWQQKERVWQSDYNFLHLADQTLGIIGLGGIGHEVAKRGHACGMKIVAVDPRTKEKPTTVDTLWAPERLDDLLRQSDFVVICAPHTPETEKMIRREQLRKMKKTAYLINVGRGVIVDLNDLTEALKAGEIAGAGLDVFEVEPLPPDHPLWQMENVIITPHVAGNSPRVEERRLGILCENLSRFLVGHQLMNVVDKRSWF